MFGQGLVNFHFVELIFVIIKFDMK